MFNLTEKNQNKESKKAKRKKIGKIALKICIGYLVFIFFIAAIGISEENKEKEIQWESLVLSEMLPEIQKPKGTVFENTDLELNVDFENIEKTDATEFIEACKKLYTVDQIYTSTDLTAYNKDGYKIEVNYSTELSVELNAPVKFSEIYWPENDAGKLLPVTKSLIGKIQSETSDRFEAYISEMTKSDYNEYVQTCQKAGFNIDYSKDETSFQASHKDGYQLRLNYEGYNIICIEIYSLDEEIEQDNTEEQSTTEETTIEESTSEETPTTDTVIEETTTQETTTETEKATVVTTTEETTEKIATTKPTTTETTTKVTTTKETTTKKSGRTVYTTPYGEKYHFSSSCAGKNARARDYNDVVGVYGPCKKCAQ